VIFERFLEATQNQYHAAPYKIRSTKVNMWVYLKILALPSSHEKHEKYRTFIANLHCTPFPQVLPRVKSNLGSLKFNLHRICFCVNVNYKSGVNLG